MPHQPSSFEDVPEPVRRGPTERVPEMDAVMLKSRYPALYGAGQEAARAGKTFWESCRWGEPMCRYAFQAGWERP